MFDRLGVRVPAVLVSPWLPQGTVVSPLKADGGIDDLRIFEHASIPATVTGFFIGDFDEHNQRSPREKKAETFLDLLSLDAMRDVDLSFDVEE